MMSAEIIPRLAAVTIIKAVAPRSNCSAASQKNAADLPALRLPTTQSGPKDFLITLGSVADYMRKPARARKKRYNHVAGPPLFAPPLLRLASASALRIVAGTPFCTHWLRIAADMYII